MSPSADYKPPLATYFETLEARYGSQFSFDKLSDDELLTLERLGHDAVEHDQQISTTEKANLRPLLTLIDMQRRKRGILPQQAS